jgi:solute carrier family 25 carnitine/acylcarnitine transporter 20/29
MVILDEAIAGSAAGAVGTLIGFPLDSLKTRMQTGSQQGVGMLTLSRKILSEEGISGFFRGVASPLVALTLLNTLNFSSYARFRAFYGVNDDILRQPGAFDWRVPLAAASVGPLASLVSTPFELIKTQMVINARIAGPEQKRKSSVSMAVHLIREYGVRSLYVAHFVNTSREMLFLGSYFTVYEHSKMALSFALSQVGVSEKGSIPIAGGISGMIGWLVSFPLDCIKSNIQRVPFTKGESIVRPRAMTIASTLVKANGISALYSGIGPSITRAFLVSASRFSVYELVLASLKGR